MGRRIVRWMAIPLSSAVFVACDEVTAPVDVDVYELVEVAGSPLPATIEEAPGFVRTYVSDVIRIYEDGRWDRVEEVRFRQGNEEEREITSNSTGTVIVDGTEVVLSYVCNDTASCIAPDRLRIVDDGAVIERRIAADSVLVWRYRVAPGGEAD